MNGEDYAQYQLIARATYLPKGPFGRRNDLSSLRYGISWSWQRPISASLRFTKLRLRLRLRYQLVDMSTYLAKPRLR